MGRGGRTGTGKNVYSSHKLITSQDSENLNRYFNDIKAYLTLNKEQEIKLLKAFQKDGNPKALDSLIKANLRFVVTVAKTYQNQGVPLLDLIQEGSSGLIEAAHRFDTKRDLKFFSYAVWWIKIKIISSFELNKRLIQLPANRTLLITKLKRKIQELEDKLQRPPIVSELRKFFPDQSESDLQEAFSYALLPLSLQQEFDHSENDTQLVEILNVPNALEVDVTDERASLLTDLNKVLYQLPQVNYDILVLLQGLNEEESIRPDKLAYLFEIEIKAIARIKAKAIKFLKKYKDQSNLNEYL